MRTKAGQAPGRDGLRYDVISRKEAPRILEVVSRSLLDGTYRPYPTRTVEIPKAGSQGTRRLSLPTIIDRVVASALNNALSPYFERIFLPRSYGFRPGRSTWTLLAQLNADILAQKRYVLAIDDIKNAFPSVNIANVLADHARYVNCPRYLGLIDTVLRAGDSTKQIGIPQGSPYSPVALNLHLHHAHDVLIAQTPSWYRFADNLAYLCQDVSEGMQALDKSRSILSQVGLTLKGVDGLPVDLRRGNAQLLGFTLSADDTGLQIDLGRESWNRLVQALQQGHRAMDPMSHAHRAIDGWVCANGPAFEYRRVETLSFLTKTVSSLDYRELGSLDGLELKMKEAYRRWQVLRDTRRQSTAPIWSGVTGMVVTAPLVTFATGGLT
jgi:hypothetical protein